MALPGAGFELDEGDRVSNPSGWRDSLQVDFDPRSYLLTLTATNGNSCKLITITKSGIVFDSPETVTGLLAPTTGQAVRSPTPFAIDLSGTADSVTVAHTAAPAASFSLFAGSSDVFQLMTVAAPTAIPLPGVLRLACIGIAAVGAPEPQPLEAPASALSDPRPLDLSCTANVVAAPHAAAGTGFLGLRDTGASGVFRVVTRPAAAAVPLPGAPYRSAVLPSAPSPPPRPPSPRLQTGARTPPESMPTAPKGYQNG